MARLIQDRLRAAAGAAYAVIRDTFFVRLLLSASALWRESRFLCALLSLLLLGLLWLAAATAWRVFETLLAGASGPLWPGLAASFVFLVLLELGAAGLMTGLSALLRLSLDIGRHRIGVVLTLAALLTLALALRGLLLPPAPAAYAVTGWLAGLALLLAVAFWFERAYRRPAYPGFRDFHADVVAARHHLGRAAHGG